VTSSVYDPILRRVINAHKERQALTLTSFIAERLALSVHVLLASEPYAASRIILVPIPSAARTVRRRGFDATASMARLAARQLRVRYPMSVRSALTQARWVADQAGLRAAARQENLAGAYRLRRPIATGAAVLVDDLVTTGSSLTEPRVCSERPESRFWAQQQWRPPHVYAPRGRLRSTTLRAQCSRTENSLRIPRKR
jgi:predicted amidophosphoribosyltransferase